MKKILAILTCEIITLGLFGCDKNKIIHKKNMVELKRKLLKF